MNIQQQYEALLKLQPEIDKRLKDPDFQEIKELLLWLAKSEAFQKLKKKRNSLSMLDCFGSIWLEEKKKLTKIGIEDDIFFGIHSLADVERKYQIMKFGMLRMETAMPEAYYRQVIDEMIDYRISGIALAQIIIRETCTREKNIIKVSRLLKEQGQIVTAIMLLEKAEEYYPQNEEIILELADCWITGQQWERALACLEKMENPGESSLKLKKELEQVISNENL